MVSRPIVASVTGTIIQMKASFWQVADEQKLLAALRAGDGMAVRKWYQLFWPAVVAFVSNKISEPADVQEVAQEVFVACLRELPLFRAQSGLRTWMLGVAKHKVADYYRARYAKSFINFLPLPVSQFSTVPEKSVQTEMALSALSALAVGDAELLLAKYVDKKTVKQLALECKQSVKAIESRLFRSRLAFKNAYLQLDSQSV